MRSDALVNISRMLLLALAVLCAGVPGTGLSAQERRPAPSEYEVKAAFVYNFVKFVEWPSAPGGANGPLRFCLLGDVPDASAFEGLAGRHVQGRSMTVHALEQKDDLRGCDVLFVASDQTARLGEVLGVLGGRPVLTVGDTEGYARRGVMINMFIVNKHVRFEINEERARTAGIRISVKLLKLASKVYGTVSGDE